MSRKFSALAAATMLVATPAFAGLVTTHTDAAPGSASVTVDGILSPNEYGPGNSYVYTGGGSGFGGTLGGGQLYLESDATNLYVGFQVGNNLNDNIAIHFDTRAGGFVDADMNDTADPGRNLLSNLTRDVDDPFPFLADFGLVIGAFGQVLFELNAGNTPGHLTFLQYDGTFTGNGTGFRELAIPLSSLDNDTGAIDFFASYGSDTNFMSNESMPAEVFNAGDNPGFDNGGNPLPHENFHRFNIPEPSSLALVALGGLFAGRRRR